MCDKQEETEQKTENSEPRVIQHDENEHEGCDQVTLQESNHADLHECAARKCKRGG